MINFIICCTFFDYIYIYNIKGLVWSSYTTAVKPVEFYWNILQPELYQPHTHGYSRVTPKICGWYNPGDSPVL